MNQSLQEKLQRMRESKLIEDYIAKLTSFEVLSIVDANMFSPALDRAIHFASRSDTPRKSKIACSEEQAEIYAWVNKMFMDSKVGADQFYLSAPFRFFPWLDCKVVSDCWIQNLSEVRDLNFSVISHNKEIFLSISNEEYWIDAYWCPL